MNVFKSLPYKKIDSHQHFWMRSRGDYDWLTPELEPIYRDFMPSDLHSQLQYTDISATVLVQAAESDAETDFMLTIAKQTEFVLGVVGWVDMESDLALARLDSLSKNPWFKGIRPMMQDMTNDNWMLKKELAPVFEKLIEKDLSFDALIKPRHLPVLKNLLVRYPELRVVINHAAKPDIASGDTQQWADDIQAIAEASHAFCKVSGLITEAKPGASYHVLTPYIQHLVNCFGTDRLMWGSDWPVVKLESDYLAWNVAMQTFCNTLDTVSQRQIWSDTARSFYKLTTGTDQINLAKKKSHHEAEI